jgi:hypothetical protein
MLHPMRLNWLALVYENHIRGGAGELEPEGKANYYGLTWFDPATESVKRINITYENIACAWEQKQRGIHLPVAVEPTTIHPRMNAQHSYFTVHGLDESPVHLALSEALETLRESGKCDYALNDLLRHYEIIIRPSEGIADLRTLGIADSTIMPDADSLAKELSRFMRNE